MQKDLLRPSPRRRPHDRKGFLLNSFIHAQIVNMLTISKSFMEACELGAYRDDGYISQEEAEQLKKIKNATAEFRKVLSSIK